METPVGKNTRERQNVPAGASRAQSHSRNPRNKLHRRGREALHNEHSEHPWSAASVLGAQRSRDVPMTIDGKASLMSGPKFRSRNGCLTFALLAQSSNLALPLAHKGKWSSGIEEIHEKNASPNAKRRRRTSFLDRSLRTMLTSLSSKRNNSSCFSKSNQQPPPERN